MANPVKGKPVEVDVYAHPPGSPEPYTIEWRFTGEPGQGNTPIRLPKASGSHDITFNLHDNSGKELRFKSTVADAIWTTSGNGCPNGPGTGNGQIGGGSVSNGGMTLQVNDDNSGSPARLHYMLRFDPDPNAFDPEIRNGGGGTSFTGIANTMIIGGAVAGALIAVWMAPQSLLLMGLVGAVAGGVLGYLLGVLFKAGGHFGAQVHG